MALLRPRYTPLIHANNDGNLRLLLLQPFAPEHLSYIIQIYICYVAEDTRYIPAALPASQVIYFQNLRDSEGQILDASTGDNYTLTFTIPIPAKAFWSLTIYNATSLGLFNNVIGRYNINDRVRLSFALMHCLQAVDASLAPEFAVITSS